MTRELKPCPFCGNESDLRLVTNEGKYGWRDQYFVLCDYNEGGCGACGGYRHYKEEAIDAWNERKEGDGMVVKDKPNKVTAVLNVVVTGEFYDDEASPETLRYCVEQDLEAAGLNVVDVSVIKRE